MSNIQIVQQQIELARPEFESNVEALNLKLVFQKEASFALQIFNQNSYLAGMNPDSIRNAIVNVSLTGLTLNPVMKMAYLIPRKGKCVLDVSYIGLTKILTDTGSVKNIEAGLVYWGEPFELQRGTEPYIKHGLISDPNKPKGDIRGAYSVATLNDGSKSIEWMDATELMSIMQRSESVKSGKGGAWSTDPGEMCRKTVIKRHYKYLPKSERAIMAATAIDIDHENNGIDFEAERREASQNHVSIDLIDPSNQDNIRKYGVIPELVNDQRVPEELFSSRGQTRKQFIDEFGQKFMDGTMQTAYADSVLNKLREFTG